MDNQNQIKKKSRVKRAQIEHDSEKIDILFTQIKGDNEGSLENSEVLYSIYNLGYLDFREIVIKLLSTLEESRREKFILSLMDIKVDSKNDVTRYKKISILYQVSHIDGIVSSTRHLILREILKFVSLDRYKKDYSEIMNQFLINDEGFDYLKKDIESLPVADIKKLTKWIENSVKFLDDQSKAHDIVDQCNIIIRNSEMLPFVKGDEIKPNNQDHFGIISNHLVSIQNEYKKLKSNEKILNNKVELLEIDISNLKRTESELNKEIINKEKLLVEMQNKFDLYNEEVKVEKNELSKEIELQKYLLEKTNRDKLKEVEGLKNSIYDEINGILPKFKKLQDISEDEYTSYYPGLLYLVEDIFEVLNHNGITIKI